MCERRRNLRTPTTPSKKCAIHLWKLVVAIYRATSRWFSLLQRIIFPSPSFLIRFPLPSSKARRKFSDFPLSTLQSFLLGLYAVACLSRLIYKFNIRHFSKLLVGIIFHFTLLAFILSPSVFHELQRLIPHAFAKKYFSHGKRKVRKTFEIRVKETQQSHSHE